MRHEIARVQHDTRRRSLVVMGSEYVTPQMLRLTLAGDDLAGFTSLAPDDHVKLFLPDEAGTLVGRDFTPRRFDAAAHELAVDFALHDGGLLTDWARAARAGDAITVGGPRGSAVVPHDFDWWCLIGDETALPAIARRIEELPAHTPVMSFVAVTTRAEEQQIATTAAHRPVWVHRPAAQADDPAALLAALEQHGPPSGEGYVWIAAERTVARAVRQDILDVWKHPLAWMKAAAYWTKGQANASGKLDH